MLACAARLLVCLLLVSLPVSAKEPSTRADSVLRLATFNIWELRTPKLESVDDAGAGLDPQLRNAAEIIQRVRPDVLLVNEIDFDSEARLNAEHFVRRYLNVPQQGQAPIDYPYRFFEPVNAGVPSGFDMDNDGKSDGPADALGYGHYPGQYGMALLSRFPLDHDGARTFRTMAWKDMPGNLIPDGRDGRPAWYSVEEVGAMPLSTKSHWDVPLTIGCQTIHLLGTHPTPPAYDGPEDHNGRRNNDEIRFWVDYLDGGSAAEYIVDDHGERGPLAEDAEFVILGDLNADPLLSVIDEGQHAIVSLLAHDRVFDTTPSSPGAPAGRPTGGPDYFERRTHDVARVDYAIPSRSLEVVGSGVFWPAETDPLHRLVEQPTSSSNHRLVWLDVRLDCTPHLVDEIPTWAAESQLIVNAVVEIPAGTREKWEVDGATGRLVHEQQGGRPRVVDYALPYPGNYGMIPQTALSKRLGGDGDPLDVIILGPPLERGTVAPVRVLGVIRMLDGGERDDKLVAIQPGDSRLGHLRSLQGLEREFSGTLRILETWFANYKRVPGQVQIAGSEDSAQARELISRVRAAYLGRLSDPVDSPPDLPGGGTRQSVAMRLMLPTRMVSDKTLTLKAELVDELGRIDWRIWHALGAVSAVRASDGSDVPIRTTVFEATPGGAGGGVPPVNGIQFYNGVGSVSLMLGNTAEEPGEIVVTVRVGAVSASSVVTVLDSSSPSLFHELHGLLTGEELAWSPADGVIHLTGNVTVPAGRRLAISPGTLVMVDRGPEGDGTAILIEGTVEARGTAAEPIYFFPSSGPAAMSLPLELPNNPASWRGLWHSGDGHSSYSHVVLVGAGNGPTELHPRPPVIRLEDAHSVTLTDCLLTDSPGKMIQGGGSGTYRLLRSVVSRTGIGGEFFGEGHRLVVEDSWFTRIGRAPRVYGYEGDMLHLGNATSEQIIRRSIFTDGGDDAIDHIDANPRVEDAIIYDLADKAVSLTNGSIEVHNTLIVKTASGIRGSAKITDSTILTPSPVDCPISVERSIIWPHTLGACNAEVHHSLLGLECRLDPDSTNVSGDPRFVDARGFDFDLQPDSPARDAGPDGEPIGWRGFPD